jgi:hypothetical protein
MKLNQQKTLAVRASATQEYSSILEGIIANSSNSRIKLAADQIKSSMKSTFLQARQTLLGRLDQPPDNTETEDPISLGWNLQLLARARLGNHPYIVSLPPSAQEGCQISRKLCARLFSVDERC